MNRRDFLRSVPAVLAVCPVHARDDKPVLASCHGTEGDAAAQCGLAMEPGPRAHAAILHRVRACPGSVGRTVFATPAALPTTPNNGRLLRTLGSAGIWARRTASPDKPLRIGVVGVPLSAWNDLALTPVAAGDCARALRVGEIDAVAGLSPGLGWALGLHRLAPYFTPLPGLVTVEAWYGPADRVAKIAALSDDTQDPPMDMAALSVTALRTRGIQVLS